MKRVLLADDEKDLREILAGLLGSKFEVIEAENGRLALQLALELLPDIVLLDVTMPELRGTEVCQKLKSHPSTQNIPVILLTAHSEVPDRVRGLQSGADDYICKPFHPDELMARIEARLRGVQQQVDSAEARVLGNLILDVETREAQVSGKKIKLTALESDMLQYFMVRVGKVVQRKELLEALWPDAVVTQRTVDTHVANLRKKVAGFDHEFESIHGSGYRLKSKP
jgi:two-component system phosphate regulon response regulator PhoB